MSQLNHNAAAAAAPLEISGESRQDFQRLVNALIAKHRPFDYAERCLVDTMALLHWRQIQTVTALMNNIPGGEKAVAPRMGSKSVQSLLRYQKSLNQQLTAAKRNLEVQQANRDPFANLPTPPLEKQLKENEQPGLPGSLTPP